jgi:hypothetical protein
VPDAAEAEEVHGGVTDDGASIGQHDGDRILRVPRRVEDRPVDSDRSQHVAVVSLEDDVVRPQPHRREHVLVEQPVDAEKSPDAGIDRTVIRI